MLTRRTTSGSGARYEVEFSQEESRNYFAFLPAVGGNREVHMGLTEITTEGVEKAITEFDELGREAFGKLNA